MASVNKQKKAKNSFCASALKQGLGRLKRIFFYDAVQRKEPRKLFLMRKIINKMKIILTEGCVCDSLTIDDKEVREYSNEELKEIIKKVLDKEKSKFNLIKFLGAAIEAFSGYFIDKSIIKTNKYGLLVKLDDNDAITVGKRNINNFTEEEIRDMILTVINMEDDNADLIWALRELIENFGRYKFCYHCDECGDNVVEYKLNV